MSKLTENTLKIQSLINSIEQLPEDRYWVGKEEGRAEGEAIGYGKGYEQGNTDGYAQGNEDGQEVGYADALAKRTEIVVTQNGEYDPPGESTGFKKVSVNVKGGEDLDSVIAEQINIVEELSIALDEKVNGYGKGYDEALSKLTDLVATENGEYLPQGDSTGFKSVNINVGDSGDAVELNIAYGDTAPISTSKLWVKTSKPSSVHVSGDALEYDEIVPTLIETLQITRNIAGSATVGKKIFLVGGFRIADEKTDTIECFDTETNTTRILTNTLPLALSRPSCTSVGDKIYVFGGYGSANQSSIYCVDTETETITTLPTKMPYAATTPYVAAIGTKIYLCGGSGAPSDVFCFDTETGKMSSIGYIPKVYYDGDAIAVGNKIYLMCGQNASAFNHEIFCIDTETGITTTLHCSLPYGIRSAGCALVGTKIYIFGGYTKDGNALVTVYCLDVLNETIELLPTKLPCVNYGMACESVGKKVYILGGYNGTERFNTINEFVCGALIPENELRIVPQLEENTFYIINTDALKVEIGAEKILKGNEYGHGDDVEAAIYKDGAWTNI